MADRHDWDISLYIAIAEPSNGNWASASKMEMEHSPDKRVQTGHGLVRGLQPATRYRYRVLFSAPAEEASANGDEEGALQVEDFERTGEL